MKKRKQNNTPRRKRLNRKQRISIARDWLKSYNGRSIEKGYSNWFGVDLLCAISELRIVGENISVEYESKVRKSIEDRLFQRKNTKKNRLKLITNILIVGKVNLNLLQGIHQTDFHLE